MDRIEAMNALAAKRDAEAQMAKAANCPPWRHAAFGLMMAALIAAFAFDPTWRAAILALAILAVPLIIRSDRKRMGMFINGYRRGKTRLVTFGLLIVWMALYATGVHYALTRHDEVMPLVLAAVAFVICTAGSVLWQRVFVREMGA